MTAADHDDRVDLERRYGRTPSTRKRDRWIFRVGAVVVAVVVVAWVVWAGLDQANSTLGAQDIGHRIIDPYTVSISYQISMPAGSTATCALQVQNEAHAIVGWKIVAIPASEQYTNSFTNLVRSSELGVTGLIYRCWLT
ncbi:MAG: DUF4307 domain-containing protein [Lacisediminihabitans sp.]